MANERLTEDIVRQHFKNDPLFDNIKFEEQKSYNKNIAELLKGQSKCKGKGCGYPEFLISFPTDSKYLIVIECKANTSKHESSQRNLPVDYAVDGVLHYAEALSKSYDVVAIAVSGEIVDELVVSHFIWKKGQQKYEEKKQDKNLLSLNDYLKLFENEHFAENLRNINIISRAITLNEEYQAYSITEMTRCTMVSAILLALIYKPFRQSYKSESTSKALGQSILHAISSVLERPDNIVRNKAEMLAEYSKLLNEPLFNQPKIKHKGKKHAEPTVEVAKNIVTYLYEKIYPLIESEESGFDILGKFYTEFIRYAGSQQSQGLVLTPSHITNLFCDLANINKNDIIYDPCCGTGGFLIAGMKRMFQLSGSDYGHKQHIRTNQLVGTEIRPDMFTYACSNMMLRGDGKSNILNGSCFDFEKVIKEFKPTVAFLNPPYDHGCASQMEFIEHALNVVTPQNGRVVAIVQMSCGIKNEKDLIEVKKRILENNHLKAVLSMPDDLFYPVGVVTSIMVFEANKPNIGLKTWFGYFKDDGFEKRKHQGRIDARDRYKEIHKKWIDAYNNLEEIEGLSIRQEVNATDEWCAEAYMETDYSTLSEEDFVKKIKDYIAFKFINEVNDEKID